ncbi:TATA element modulatory factor-like isoform X2 [Daphnia pulicaria]|uniref:TATA element modulatory factor-like isoform X2 n=1 Tax=Daphnia pulicaria TaxID=35523 RepID=UPI001EEA67F7|nr:TATA element modulatory factor-like isoform X2 [Daphnia pulicaria]
MSWLNTSSIANLAKNALKEAQKTIDKALDIRDPDAVGNKPIENEIIGHFFESFNLVKEENDPPDETRTSSEDVVVSEPDSKSERDQQKTVFQAPVSNVLQTTAKDLSTHTETSIPAGDLEKKSNPNELDHVVLTDSIEETNVNESYHSSMSVSSSITVISPENDLADMDWKSDTKSDVREETTNHHRTQNRDEVSTMLSEAMKDSIKTETSASASGDEIETTTSSDIEIIASPQAGIRQLVAPVRSRSESKTHSRKPSEASSDDSATSTGQDSDPLKTECQIIQLNQILEARDNQLLEYTRKCYALSEEVERAKSQLAHDEKERTALGETIRRQSDEFAIRLSSIEKRYQQVLAERESLVKKLEQIQQNQESYGSLTEELREKNETIEQLRFEGEKLSKQHLQLSNIIKKLRVQEKEEEVRCKQFKDQNEELKSEVDRLNKCLSAKEELERNQIEAVRQSAMVNSQLEKELLANKVMMREKLAEVETLRAAFFEVEQKLLEERATAAIRDSAETERNLSAEVALRQRLQLEYETSSRLFEEERQALTMRCQELTQSLAEVDSDRSRERERIQSEVSRLMHRLHEAESRSDELSQALTTATKPLIRQIDTLQHALTSQRLSEERSEKMYNEKLAVLESKLLSANQKETVDKNLYLAMQAQVDEALEKCKTAEQENHNLRIQLEQEKCHSQNLEQARKKDNFSLELVKSQLIEEVTSLRSKIEILESNYEKQCIALEEERKKTSNFTNRLQDKELEFQVFPTVPDMSISGSIGRKVASTTDIVSRTSSPTPSLGKLSLSGSFTESHSSNPWNTVDEVFDGGLVTPVPKSTLYDAMRAGSYTAVFESLQAQLKTRDGEVTQLQQELQNQERSRDSLAKELTEMINTNQELSHRLDRLETLLQEYEDLKTKYNALLQMYGEKIEENEELRLDLVDVKEMYKAQIDHLMKT